MSENGEIYTAGKNFTLPPAVTAWTNSTSVSLLILIQICCHAVTTATKQEEKEQDLSAWWLGYWHALLVFKLHLSIFNQFY